MTKSDIASTAPRWFQRVLPVTGLLLAIVAVVALLSPAVRDQVALSTTRQPQPFVELYFAQARSAAACGSEDGKADVRFVVASHLEDERRLTYTVTTAADGGDQLGRRRGVVRLQPEESRTIRVTVPVAKARAHTVVVSLPATDQELRVHCPAARP